MKNEGAENEFGLDVSHYISKKIRFYRQRAGLTLSHLSILLDDISFQQLQKYESGANRVSSSRLFMIANVLSVPISNFFPRPEIDNHSSLSLSEEKELQNLVLEGAFAKEVYLLMHTCMQIEDHEKRKEVLVLCQQVVNQFVTFEKK